MTRRDLRIGAVLAALAVGCAWGEPRAADDLRVRAWVEPGPTVNDAEPFALAVAVEGTEVPDVSIDRLTGLTNLRVLSGPFKSQSSSFELRGTSLQRSASVILRYTLLAEGPGPAEIPSLEVRVGSRTMRTEAIRIQAVRGRPGAAAGPQRRPRAGARDRQAEPADVLLRAECRPTEAWIGQPILLEVVLFAAGGEVERFSWLDPPSLEGFWVEDVAVDPNAERTRAEIGGRPYVSYPVMRRVLVPTSAGDLEVAPFTGQIQVRRSTGDLFEDFFLQGRGSIAVRTTDPIRIRVKPLPEQGRPEDFSGAVGSFRVRATFDRREARVDDAIGLRVSVEGDGLLETVRAPSLDAPQDVKVFEPKTTGSVSVERGRIRSTKTWEWVLVPLHPGEVRMPPVRFSYFDPSQGAFREVREELGSLVVRRGEPSGEERGIARGAIRAEREDIAFIKPLRGELSESGPGIHRRPVFLAFVAVPLLALPVGILLGRHRARLRKDLGLARSRRAAAVARRRLRAAERRAARSDGVSFHEEVGRALVEYVADRFNRPPAGLTYDVADDLLASRGVEAPLRGRFRACLETCDFARFVPESRAEERMADVLREAREIVTALERSR